MASLRSPPHGDVVLAGVLATYGVVEALVLEGPTPWLAGVLAATLPLAWRRRFPVPVIGFVLAVVLVPGAAGYDPFDSVLPLPLFVVAAYTAGREAASVRIAGLGAAAIGGAVTLGSAFGPAGENSGLEDLVALVVVVGGAAAAGHVMRVRETENRQLGELTVQLAAERDLRAQAAVLEERARVARELHDIVAHSVSLIAVQAGAADELLGRDEARAREALRSVQQTARSALTEMRRLLTVLRADDETPGLAPQPGLADVADLVAQARDGGLPVELHEGGERGAIPPGVDLSAFRIVQEALTNVRMHAGAVPTEVLVRYEPDAVLVEVSNADDDGRSAAGVGANGHRGGGHGIAGMRERARLYGGTLEVDRGDGRYVVHARLPLGGTAE